MADPSCEAELVDAEDDAVAPAVGVGGADAGTAAVHVAGAGADGVLHQWLSQLSYRSEGPVHVVLCADGPCWWQEPWTDALAEALEHLRVHFRVRGESGWRVKRGIRQRRC